MSKSRGNTIDPIETIYMYGADAFRFALVFCTLPNPYMSLPESQIEAGKRFANKIWNASRFLLMNLDGFDQSRTDIPDDRLYLCDRWIRSRFNDTVKNVTGYVEEFRFSDAAHALYEFLWHEFCDWYIELIKQRLYYTDDSSSKQTVQSVASDILERTMRLLHPIMPFLTEEIWQRLPHEGDSIMIASWPEPNPAWDDPVSENAMQTIMNVIESIRSIRGEMNVAPASEVEILIKAPSAENLNLLETHLEDYLPSLTRISSVSIAESLEKPSACATAVVDDLTIYVPLAGLIDIDAERKRLQKRLGKLTADLAATQKTLDNPKFIERAPETVVIQKQDLLERFESEKEKLESNLNMLE